MVNKWQKSTKIVSFIVATLLGIVAIYFAMQSGKYIASPAPNGGEAPQITTPIGTMNTNLYALLLVLIALWLFVGCVLAFVTGFDACHDPVSRSPRVMILLGVLSLLFLAIPSGVLELMLARFQRENTKR